MAFKGRRLHAVGLALAGTLVATSAAASDIHQSPSPTSGSGWDAPGRANPLLPGYFADPSIVHEGRQWYIFATMDPWGGDRLGLWSSRNGRDWSFSKPTWPTKLAATSPTSGKAKVWAPSVVKAPSGRWYMYVSVGSEVWVGSAPSPAGPWRDANGGKPLIAKSFAPQYHMIDAEAFIDDDGQAYLYWGSGLNWRDGHCFVVRLKPDMVSFDGAPRDVTPKDYFEAPFMLKAGGRYVLTYSEGNTTKDSYKVRYAIGDGPMGPFEEAANSPILETDAALSVISPGHHAVFRSAGRPYILYHRQALPWVPGREEVLRQVVIDPLELRSDGTIAHVAPSHGGPVRGFAPRRTRGFAWHASGTAGDIQHAPSHAADDNYATLWKPDTVGRAELIADLSRVRHLTSSDLRPEYVDRPYRVGLDSSLDGRRWTTVVAPRDVQGSPIHTPISVKARYLRLVFPDGGAALWEWVIR